MRMSIPKRRSIVAKGPAVWALSLLMCGTAWAADPSPQAVTNKASTKTPAGQSSSAKDAAGKQADGKAAPASKRRIVTVGGGQIALDIRHWPLLGNPNARHVFVEMFDYTCPYCRATHPAVRGAMEHFGDELAIIALPVPLDASCNRTVGSTAAEHAEACEIAKLAVAVWRVNRKAFPPFHSWLFEAPRTAADARQHAAELVGEKALNAELSLPHAANYIARHVDLYERVGSGSLPKMLFVNSTVSGSIESASTLIDMITRDGLAPQ